ncbi:MAG: hypothetical protein H3C38_09110 [Rhodospirillales bacterium]|nr:hypothetical protein [Rhodospirillales bacterium]
MTARLKSLLLAGCLAVGLVPAAAARDLAVEVRDATGAPLPLAMVTVRAERRVDGVALAERTAFTGPDGRARLSDVDDAPVSVRVRKPDHRDAVASVDAEAANLSLTVERETDARAIAEARPANAWAAAIDLGDPALSRHFRLQCGFCHQQGSPAAIAERSEEEWEKIIDRMVRYGSRLQTAAQKRLPELLRAEHRRLRESPQAIPEVKAWEPHLAGARITEWALGDGASQLHDVFLASTGKLYAGDNLQDNLIELDPATGRTVTHNIPRAPGDKLGGNIGGRLKNFPGVGTYVGLHSLDESPVDGHLFLTGSDSSRLVEFAPETGRFTLYDLPDGYYPHTIRVDRKDRVWFTMAVSNQIAMFDRKAGRFTFYDLPARTLKERATILAMPVILKLFNWGVPMYRMPIDEKSDGLPLPYGIDIAPDGRVWFTRLHADEIGRVDPDTGEVRMFKTPFVSPRRLRADADGNLWITVFAEGRLAKFDPATERFTLFDLPTRPAGSETPYSLNVDRRRGIVWINGTASDSMLSFDIKREEWRVYPLPRRRTFTRDVVVADDGSIFTSNGSFPAWHIEDGQPTVIRVTPGPAEARRP